MSHAFPPAEVIRTAASTTAGPVHVSQFLAQAFAELGGRDAPESAEPTAPAPAAVNTRADIAKCRAARLATCTACVRNLAPAGPGQQWVEPDVDGGACALFASVDTYGPLFGLAAGGASK